MAELNELEIKIIVDSDEAKKDRLLLGKIEGLRTFFNITEENIK